MMKPPPSSESERLAVLDRLAGPDKLPIQDLQELVRAARIACGAPTAAVSRVEQDLVRFCARDGALEETYPRPASFCSAAIESSELLEVGDAHADARFSSGALVRRDPGYRFYAGVPLILPGGFAMGTICVFDSEPRRLTREQREVLGTLAKQVLARLDLTRRTRLHSRPSDPLRLDKLETFELMVEERLIGLWDWDIWGGVVQLDEEWARQHGFEPAVLRGDVDSWISAHHPEDVPALWESMSAHLEGKTDTYHAEYRLKDRDGNWRWVSSRGKVVSRDSGGRPLRVIGGFTDIEKRKLAETQLKDSQRFVDTLLSNLPGMVYRCRNEPNWPFEYVSGDVVNLTGYPPAKFLVDTLSLTDIIHEEDRQQVWDKVQEGVRRNKPFEITYRLQRADGQWRWVWERGRAVPAGDGSETALEGFITDITDRKRAKDELAARTAFIESILDNLPIGILVQRTSDLSPTYWNASYKKSHGWSEELIRNQAALMECMMPDPEYRRAALEEFRDWAASGPNEVARFGTKRITTSTGEERLISVNAIPVPSQDVVIIAGEDVTERRKAEEAKRQSEEMFRQLAENVREVSWIMAWETGRLLYMSSTYAEVWGRPVEDVMESPDLWLDTVVAEDRDTVAGAIAGRREPPWEIEYRILRPDGALRWIRTRAFPVRDASGRTYRVAGVSEDITERQLALQKLEEAKAAAEDATRLKDEFLGNVSHELRTPIAGVIGMTDLTLDTELTVEQREYLETLRTSARSLLGIIDQLLDFAQIESGRLALTEVEFDVWELVENVLGLYAGQAAAKDIDLGCRIDARLAGSFMGDPNRLRQVLVNLIDNGIKFTKSGSVIVDAALEGREDSRARVRVEVKDTGIGIRPEDREKLFRPFSQTESATNRRFGGTGLGLAISSRIVEAMGGEIGVESRPEEGSTFWFTVRLRQGEMGPPAERQFGFRAS